MEKVSQFNLALGIVMGSLEGQTVEMWLLRQGIKDTEIDEAKRALKVLAQAAYGTR